jgi:hypothetical protein
MLDLLQNVDPADLLAFSRLVPEDEDFLLSREILPNALIQNVKWRIRENTRFRSVAKFRAYDTETPYGRREVSTKVTEGFLPPLGQKLTVGELQTILLDLQRGADDQDLVDALYDDAASHVRAIRARMELAAGDLIADGVFSLIDENGLTLEADFGVDSSFLPTASVLWTDAANSTPLDDEQAWIQKLIDDGEGRPTRVTTSHRAHMLFAKSLQYQRAYFGRNDASFPTLTPAQVQSVRDSYGLPPITEYDTQVRVDGVNQRVLSENLWVMSTPGLGECQYGITAEAIALNASGNPKIERKDQPGIVVTSWQKDDPVSVGTKGSAVGMPLLNTSKGYIAATVAAF